MTTKEVTQVNQSVVTPAVSRGATSERTARVRRPSREVMLVSTSLSPELRHEASAGARPRPEYLVLEGDYGVELLDWSRVLRRPTRRTPAGSLRQVATGLLRSRGVTAFLSDGEHVGLPLAQGLALRPRRPGHVVLAHHLTTPSKRKLLRLPGVAKAVDYFVVHSQTQVEALVGDAGLPPAQVRLLPYGVDTDFWSAGPIEDDPLVVSPGREHRDHVTFAAAMDGLDARAFVTDGSSHSPAARRRAPSVWPANVDRGSLGLNALRELYARAAVVVVPLVPTDFPAGITVAVEAMAMGKAVVISSTEGLRGALADPDAVVMVPPGDVEAMQLAITSLLSNPERRRRLGERARSAAREHHDVRHFGAALHQLMIEAARTHG
jgi:glycosyltransferase involved in cell wall biosynthesis